MGHSEDILIEFNYIIITIIISNSYLCIATLIYVSQHEAEITRGQAESTTCYVPRTGVNTVKSKEAARIGLVNSPLMPRIP